VAIAATAADAITNDWGFPRQSKALSHTEVAVEQVNTDNCLISILVTHLDTVGSFNNFTGIGQANQAAAS
jgi:hypothetical protein